MKDKLLRINIMAACETIAKALRAYTGESLACEIFIETREDKTEDDTDFVAIKCTWNSEDEGGTIFDRGERIYYRFDRYEGEQILKTVPVFGGYQEEGDNDDPQG